MKQRDTIKITLVGFSLLLAMAGFVGICFHRSVLDQTRARELVRFESNLNLGMAHVKSHLDGARTRTLFLAKSREVKGLVRANQNNGFDPVEKQTAGHWNARVTNLFSNIALNNGYMQLRFIGVADEGREIVRVELSDGTVTVTPDSRLQHKGNRAYFAETMALEPGQTFQSDIELNREHGIVQFPRKPVVRIATPVVDDGGELFGMIVINIDAELLLEILRDSVPERTDVIIANQSGRVVNHPNPRKAFREVSGIPYFLASEFPDLAGQTLSGNGRLFSGSLRNAEGDRSVLYAHKITLDATVPDRWYLAALSIPERDLTTGIDGRTVEIAGLALLFSCLASSFLYWSCRHLTSPVSVLAKTAHEILEGTPFENFRGKSDSPGDIRQLQTAFVSIISLLQAREAEMEENNARLETVMNGVDDAVLLINETGKIETVNRAAQDMFGYSAAELTGLNIKTLMPAVYAQRHDEYLRRHFEDGTASLMDKNRTVTGLKKDGSSFAINVSINVATQDGETKFIGIMTDVSDLNLVNQMKSEFVSTVSHELRTPLSAMKGTLGLVLAGVGGELSEHTRDLVETASSNCSRLIVLINDILDMEKFETGKMSLSFDNPDLSITTETAVRECQSLADTYEVSIELQLPDACPVVQGDSNRIIQVIANLLSNAIKFSPRGGTVTIGIARHDSRWRLSVSDQGPGVPPEFQGKIFQKFTQADNSTKRKVGGSGLGLSISKAIIIAHNGLIDYQCDGDGSTFFFELNASDRKTNVFDGLDAGPMGRIMIFVDDPETISLVRGPVENFGYQTVVTSDVSEAREQLQNGWFDMIVVDWDFRDGESLELLEFLCVSGDHKDIPVIALSRSDPGDTGKASLLYWFQKPLQRTQIREVLDSIKPRSGCSALRVLHVEDDEDHLNLVSSLLHNVAEVDSALTVEEGAVKLQTGGYDVIILDQNLPDGTGVDLLKIIKDRPNPPEIMIYSVDSPPQGFQQFVGPALVKSEVDNEKLFNEIKTLLRSARRSKRS